MKRSIEQKIAKLVLGLQVRDLQTLLSNMVIIEQRIHKMPALLEWMEPKLSLNTGFHPTGFTNLYTEELDSLVKLWIFVLQARYGNLAFRYVPALDLQSWGVPVLPDNLLELSELQWLRCDEMPVGTIPSHLVLWVTATVYSTIPNDIRQQNRWVIQLDGTSCVDVVNVIGVDGFNTTIEDWLLWVELLDWQSIQVCRVPVLAEQFDFLKEARDLKVLDCSELIRPLLLNEMDGVLSELKVFRMLNSSLLSVPNWIEGCQNLTVLEIGWNPIQELPTWVTTLTQLKYLNCAYTEFQNFPVSIFHSLNLERLVVRSENSKVTKAWLTEVQELSSTCSVIRQRNPHSQSLWTTSLCILG